jgi:hypothetical protein
MARSRQAVLLRRNARILVVLVALVLVLLLAVRFALQPQRATRFLLQRVGNSLGLDISASGAAEYRLRGTPTLVIRDVVAREPGAAVPLLTADRILLSLPWSTIRARGAVLDAERLELDAPVLQMAALQHWLATRPPSEAPHLPLLERGLQVRGGSIRNQGTDAGWSIDGVAIDLPRLAPGEPLHARLRGRYVASQLRVPFDLALALSRAAALVDAQRSGLGVAGRLAVVAGDWTLPAYLHLAGPLQFATDDIRISPANAGIAGEYRSATTALPFAFGAQGPLRYVDSRIALAPAHVVLRGRGLPGDDPLPDAIAHGALALGDALQLRLDGRIAHWPAAWPALPAPLGRPAGPIPVALDYAGPADLSGIVALRASKAATRFDGRFRVAAVQAWVDGGMQEPLPPLDGSLRTPLLEIAGARLEGVSVEIDDPLVDAAK